MGGENASLNNADQYMQLYLSHAVMCKSEQKSRAVRGGGELTPMEHRTRTLAGNFSFEQRVCPVPRDAKFLLRVLVSVTEVIAKGCEK